MTFLLFLVLGQFSLSLVLILMLKLVFKMSENKIV